MSNVCLVCLMDVVLFLPCLVQMVDGLDTYARFWMCDVNVVTWRAT